MLDLSRFDAMIAWMPAVAIAPLLPLAQRAGIRHRLLFIWDFFPHHPHEIGRLPGGLPFRIARWWEQRLLGRFSAILCTLPGNADYLRAHYRVRADQRVLVTPVWSDAAPVPAVDRAAVRARYGLPAERPIAVFGGQFVAGRGFDQMLDAAGRAAAAHSPLLFVFVGGGPLAPALRARTAACENVRWLPAMPRADYLALLGACDVGMVATVPGVTSFSIPSKTIDYLRAGLPVIAAVEHGSDFVEIIRRYGVGRVVPFGDAWAFQDEATRLAAAGDCSAAAARCLDEVLHLRHTLAAIDAATAG
jgi:glycosyltransferase involved in cell wall biosynthesis